MTSKESIFISYRRSDSQDVVGRIDDYLTDHFGREHIFLDRNSIDYGSAFPDRLTQAMQDSKVVLVVIGSSWSSAQDEKGRRLENLDDWVRQEIALALERGLVVIPVLLDNTNMPSREELPPTIQKLAERNAIDLITRRSTNLFKAGMDEIIALIEKRVPELKPAPPVTLHPFEFEVFTVYLQAGLLGKKLIYESQEKTAKQFIEDLGNGVYFEMVSISGGNFMMGAPAEEEDALEGESPQHCVTVPPFLMGKYAVTQRLWQTVASFPKVERELDLNPSEFKRDQQPVETVSWFDAVEFCQRLSKKTGRNYRLPSEAEWEYACRAGTTTPFHLGETVTFEWVNCDGSKPYGDAPKSECSQQTTDVGSSPANAFGLFDMHGNVWEWCVDHWHDDYTNAPMDGSAWVTDGEFEHRLLRGGSWITAPGNCRSASRGGSSPADRCYDVGFRVVCSVPRTL